MSTLAENIQQAISDFGSIKSAIVAKGVNVPDNTKTSQYGALIGQIQGSGSSNTILAEIPLTQSQNGYQITNNGGCEVKNDYTFIVYNVTDFSQIYILLNGDFECRTAWSSYVNPPVADTNPHAIEGTSMTTYTGNSLIDVPNANNTIYFVVSYPSGSELKVYGGIPQNNSEIISTDINTYMTFTGSWQENDSIYIKYYCRPRVSSKILILYEDVIIGQAVVNNNNNLEVQTIGIQLTQSVTGTIKIQSFNTDCGILGILSNTEEYSFPYSQLNGPVLITSIGEITMDQSDDFGGTVSGWRAFNEDRNNLWHSSTDISNDGHWVSITFPILTVISQFTIQNRTDYSGTNPGEISFQGKSGENWEEITNFIFAEEVGTGKEKTVTITNPKMYSSYRWKILSIVNNDVVSIGRIIFDDLRISTGYTYNENINFFNVIENNSYITDKLKYFWGLNGDFHENVSDSIFTTNVSSSSGFEPQFVLDEVLARQVFERPQSQEHEYISWTGISDIDINNGISLQILFKTSYNSNGAGHICAVGPIGSSGFFSMRVSSGKLGISTWGLDPLSDTIVNDNEWHQAIFTYKNNVFKMYCDGELVYSNSSWGRTPAPDRITIGSENHDGIYNTRIANFLIYNKALDGLEVQKNYLFDRSRYGIGVEGE